MGEPVVRPKYKELYLETKKRLDDAYREVDLLVIEKSELNYALKEARNRIPKSLWESVKAGFRRLL